MAELVLTPPAPLLIRLLFPVRITFPLESILMLSVPPSLNAIVSAAGKKRPVLVSPVGLMAGVEAEPVPDVIDVVETRVGMVPVVMVAAVEVVVPKVPVAIVPVVMLALVPVAPYPA